MRGLLIVLCVLGMVAAVLAGGCAFLFGGLVAASFRAPENPANRGVAANAMALGMLGLVVGLTVMAANGALITAVSRGQAPRLRGWFRMLAIMDFAIAASLVAAMIFGLGAVLGTSQWVLLAAALVLKGILTLRLPAEPTRLPPAGPPPA